MALILLVCRASRARAPMAGALLRQLLGRNDPFASWHVETAGTWAVDDLPPMPHAQAVMTERGLDLRQHRSRCVSGELLRESDLVLAMEAGQKEALQVEFPDVADRIHLLSEMSGRAVDILDPTGGSLNEYRRAAVEIEHWLAAGYARIVELARAAHASRATNATARVSRSSGARPLA
jgi:protein-tyrosine-phosphatase